MDTLSQDIHAERITKGISELASQNLELKLDPSVEVMSPKPFIDPSRHNKCKSNNTEENRDLFSLHPGNVKFSELASTMRPVIVPGLENLRHGQDLMGSVEGVDFKIESSDENIVQGGELVLENSLVWVHYAFFLEDEEFPFDSSMKRHKGKAEVLIVSPARILPILVVAIRWLRAGQRGRFLLPPSAYGGLGLLSTVPPDSSVLLLIDVIKTLDAGAVFRYDRLSPTEKQDFVIVKQLVISSNAVAKDYFSRKKMNEVKDFYQKSLEILEGCVKTKENKSEINKLLVKTYINLALTLNMDSSKNTGEVLHYLDKASVLEDFMTNCKALFIRGMCHMKLSEYNDAQYFLLKSFELEPFNEEIGCALEKLEEVLAKSKSVETQIGKNISHRKHELNEETKKFNEQFISKEDKEKVLKCCDVLESNSIKCLSVSKSLLNEELKLLADILLVNGGIYLKEKKIETQNH